MQVSANAPDPYSVTRRVDRSAAIGLDGFPEPEADREIAESR